jgi:pseudaminic acid synthase
MTLHRLYSEAFTPWEWQPHLKTVCEELGMDFFSSPFDPTAVTFLESIDVCAYKVASPEIVDIPLLRLIGATRKPVILSTGMATLAEIDEAIATLRAHGTTDLALLKCTSAYPAPPGEMNLSTIPHMAETFGIPVGLSDHSMGHSVAVAAVALGACVVEKHLTMARSEGGADAGFSMEPDEFREMVGAVRTVEAAIGRVSYQPSESEIIPRRYRRSLFAVENIRAGEEITEGNVRSIRPGQGLHPRHLDDVLGRRATCDIRKGTPLSWDLV